MELTKEEEKIISDALIRASNLTESEWLKIEKIVLESHPPASNEKTGSYIWEMWNELHQKVEDAMERMKKLEK